MKTAVRSSLPAAFLGLLVALSAGHASASFNADFVVPPNTFVTGNNTFYFSIAISQDNTLEDVDNIQFQFPSGITVVSGSGPSPYTGCQNGGGNYSQTANVAVWATPGHPSGCGAFHNGTFNFSVTVSVPAGFAGPMNVVVYTLGDGWPSPYTDFSTVGYGTSYPALFECLDVDGNGYLDALTDGLLLMRALFGLTGTSATNGAIGNGASRTTWASIRAHLNDDCGANFAP